MECVISDKRIGEGKDKIGDVISNFDHKINNDIAERLQSDSSTMAGYPGWNFWGKVWFQDGLFHCEVWIYGSYNETFSHASLQEIMDDICSRYGSE